MKFVVLIVLAILGLANASLNDDIQEIKALIPIDEIKALTLEYADNDSEFQQVVAYLRSDEFLAIVTAIRDTPEWTEFVEYLDDAGVNIVGLIESISNLLGLGSRNFNAQGFPQIQKRAFHTWLNAVIDLIPTDDIVALIKEKRQTSVEFQALWARLEGEEFQRIAAAVDANPEWQTLLQKGRDHGAPVDAWLEIIKSWFGWSK